MLQYIIIGIILAAAVAFAAKKIYDTFTGKGDCGCGSGTACPNCKND